MSELNLLPNVAKFQASKMKMRTMAKKASMYIGIVWVVALVGVFGFWAVTQNRVGVEQRRYDRAKEEFEALKEEIVLTQQMKYKTKIVSEILDERFEYHQVFKLIQSMFGENIRIEKTEIKEGNYIAIVGSTIGVKNFKEVEDKHKSINNKEIQGLASAKLSNVQLGADTWRFNMEVDLE